MVYRKEHPKPQFQRKNWINLNGTWEFDFITADEDTGLFDKDAVLSKRINVPFCAESKLSGIEYKGHIKSVWYRRRFSVTEEQLNDRVILHFGAVDYETDVYMNGRKCGSHKGGYSSFGFDVTEFLTAGENTVAVNARDDTKNPLVPSGKQSDRDESYGCFYTRTTGIWQTVWLEFVPQVHIKSVKYCTDIENGTLTIIADLTGAAVFTAEAFFEGKTMGTVSSASGGGSLALTLPLREKHLWQPGKGRLYDLFLTYGQDRIKSYFGLRNITIDGRRVLINGKPVFQRLVLDQGFYPDGIYTAPSDEELELDIRRSMDMGFNGARLHEKVFEERFLYHCDRLGYLVWGEYPNWGLDLSRPESIFSILPEWLEVLKRDFNHPAIIGWCPFNETWDTDGRRQCDDVLKTVYLATKAADSSRPCIDTSGNFHVITDIYDLHDYEQDPEIFASHYKDLAEKGEVSDFPGAFKQRQNYDGKKPFFISEYGGIGWTEKGGWGYGNNPESAEEFISRFRGLTLALLSNPAMFGLCYTQLTDVEQEQNGLYTYDRKPKFPPEIIKDIMAAKAAAEE